MRRLLALAFFAAAIVHAAALAWPTISEPAPPWRHAVFVLINCTLAFGIIHRPRGFVLVYALFTVQQLVSHGASGWHAWREQHRVDWASAVTLVFVPIVLLLLLREERPRGSRGPNR